MDDAQQTSGGVPPADAAQPQNRGQLLNGVSHVLPVTTLQIALDLIDQAIPVFPVKLIPQPDGKVRKVPQVDRWNTDGASIDEGQIRAWFGPGGDPAYLIGVPTGELGGFDVIDIDLRKGGDKWLAENRHRIPTTREHTSQSGGTHFFLKHKPGISRRIDALAPGVDVLGDNGYIVWWPGSGHPFIDRPLNQLPEWPDDLAEAAAKKRRRSNGRGAPLDVRLPPSAGAVVELLNRMPNPLGLTYDDYVSIGLAANGCIQALDEAGLLTPEDAQRIVDAWVDWAQRWEGYNGTDEAVAWAGKIEPYNAPYAAWQTLQRFAGKLIPGYREEIVAAEFAAATLPPGLSKATIEVRAGLVDITATQAEDAIAASGLPVFQRGDAVVRPATWQVPAADGSTTLTAGLKTINQAGLIDVMAQTAIWLKYDGRAKKNVRIDPPGDVAGVLLSRNGFWRLPQVVGVVTVPTMRSDGTVLDQPGYDPATRLYYNQDPALRLLPLDPHPSREAALAALNRLAELLSGFPFVAAVDKSIAYSGLITPVVRGAIPVAPLHAWSAPAPGTGKSFLVDVVSVMLTGQRCPVVGAAKTEEEREKKLAMMLLNAAPIISIDNLSAALGGDLLCQAVERPIVQLRIFSKLEGPKIESRATLYGNGNNLVIEGDMVRRTLCGEMDARVERPELRTFAFNPLRRVMGNRGQYLTDCLTIVQAYLTAGSPNKLRPLASFESWSDLVRSALVWLGCADPVDSMEAVRGGDPVLMQLDNVLRAWSDCFGQKGYTAHDAAQLLAMPEEEAAIKLRGVLLPIVGSRGQIDATQLGNWFRKHAGRIVDGRCVQKVGNTKGTARWAVLASP